NIAVDDAFGGFLNTALNEGRNAVAGAAGNDSWNYLKTQLPQKMKRVIQTMPQAAKAAFLDREALSMLKAPRTAYRRLLRKRDEMSIEALLDKRSRFRNEFLPIFNCLNQYPRGSALR